MGGPKQVKDEKGVYDPFFNRNIDETDGRQDENVPPAWIKQAGQPIKESFD